MADSVTYSVKGLRELGEAMRHLSAEVANKTSFRASNAAAQVVKSHAEANIRKSPSIRTGRLLAAVIVKRLPKSERGRLTAEHIVTVRGRGKRGATTGAPHAHFVEFGTVYMPAEPFLGPALRQNQKSAIDAMKRELERGIIKNKYK